MRTLFFISLLMIFQSGFFNSAFASGSELTTDDLLALLDPVGPSWAPQLKVPSGCEPTLPTHRATSPKRSSSVSSSASIKVEKSAPVVPLSPPPLGEPLPRKKTLPPSSVRQAMVFPTESFDAESGTWNDLHLLRIRYSHIHERYMYNQEVRPLLDLIDNQIAEMQNVLSERFRAMSDESQAKTEFLRREAQTRLVASKHQLALLDEQRLEWVEQANQLIVNAKQSNKLKQMKKVKMAKVASIPQAPAPAKGWRATLRAKLNSAKSSVSSFFSKLGMVLFPCLYPNA